MKFESGDRVVLTKDEATIKAGSKGFIRSHDGTSMPMVNFDNGRNHFILECNLKLESESKTEEQVLASRHNTGKIRPTLFPVIVFKECIKVLTFGADKYGDYNWQKGFEYLNCADSLERHWLAWKSREDIDDESKCYHLAHVMINAMFLLYYQLKGGYEHLDNRKD